MFGRWCVPVLTCLLLHSATVARPRPTEVTAALQASVPRYLGQYSVPGAAVAVIRQGRVIWLRGFGLADIAAKRGVTADTLFNVGSISKSVTAAGVLRLVEQRKLDLDRPINEYLTRWQVPPSSLAVHQVTARRLLSHTAGISSHGYDGTDPALPVPPVEDFLTGKTGTGAVSLVIPPGSNFAYSGANYLILQLALEEVSGQSFGRYMAREIFTPLGMTRSGFDLPRDRTAMATPYDAAARPLPLLRYREASAAGLVTSARELAAFAAALLKPSAPLAEAMRPVPNTQWAARDPFGPAPQYGLGFNVRPEQYGAHGGIGHGGSNSGWESWLQVIPDTGDGIVILTNSSNGSALIAAVLCEWRRDRDARAGCPTIEVRIPVFAEYRARGVEAALELHGRLRSTKAAEYDLGSRQLNSLAYQVMRAGDLAAATRFFELNTTLFPDEWNVHDSLGEAYAQAGRTADAVRSYERSLQLNPYSDSGKQALQTLRATPEPR